MGPDGIALDADHLAPVLLTDKDAPGYTYDASQDSKDTSTDQDVVTSGGAVCQRFVDAENGWTQKYNTTAEVDRQLKKNAANHAIQDSLLDMPTSAKAAAMIADLTSGVQGCKDLKMDIDGSPGEIKPILLPQLTKSGQVGYMVTMTVGGQSIMMAAYVVQVGSAVSVVALAGPPTTDKNSLQQMGAALGTFTNIQVGRLKKAKGLG